MLKVFKKVIAAQRYAVGLIRKGDVEE